MGNVLRHPRYGNEGGEWDTMRRIPKRLLRSLTAARFFTRHGLEPDVAASHYIIPAVAGVEDTCAAVDWYVDMAKRALIERRRFAHWQRHAKLARNRGYITWFDYRDALSRERGYSSYRHERREKGWTG